MKSTPQHFGSGSRFVSNRSACEEDRWPIRLALQGASVLRVADNRCSGEMLIFLALTLLFSAPALSGAFSHSMIFLPEAVRNGEWWRVLTHPFVHVTRYHLLLDGAAFLLLYHSLRETRLARRLAYVIAGGLGSLVSSCAMASGISTGGLCGLSGIAHGLMAVSAIEMITAERRGGTGWKIGCIALAVVIGKALFEAATGRAFLDFLHFGLMGNPVAVSHIGGIAGSLAAWVFLRLTVSRGQIRRNILRRAIQNRMAHISSRTNAPRTSGS